MKVKVVAFAGQPLSGKTFVLANIFHMAKKIPKPETKYLDFEPDEQERGSTTTVKIFSHLEKDNRFYFIDTPGFVEFIPQSQRAVRMADAVMIFVRAGSVWDSSVENIFLTTQKYNIPSAFVITQYSSEDWQKTLNFLQELAGPDTKPFAPPGKPFNLENLTEEFMEEIISTDDKLLEEFLEGHEIRKEELFEVMEKALSTTHIHPVFFVENEADIRHLLFFLIHFMPPYKGKDSPTAVIFKSTFDPSIGEQFYARAFRGISKGTELLNKRTGNKEKISHLYVPFGKDRIEVEEVSEGEIIILPKLKDAQIGDVLTVENSEFNFEPFEDVFKPYVIAVKPKGKSDEEKISEAMQRLLREDPTFSYEYDVELHQHLLKCQGATHANSIISKLKNKFNVEVEIMKPKIPYRETIRKPSQGMGKFVKQTGGRGQYGIAMIRIEPLPRGQNYEFKNSIFGGAIPKEYIPSVEAGIKKAMAEGVIAGYPVIDVKVDLYDGKYHPVDSSNFAFEVAGTLAFKEAAAGADPYILEPIYEVEIFVPETYLGDTIGEINSRRGRVLGFEAYERDYQRITAHIPLENVYDLIVPLRSITKGRCWIRYSFSHYEEAPKDIQNRLIEEYKRSRGGA
jgi:Translation elongation factors (GTPases)